MAKMAEPATRMPVTSVNATIATILVMYPKATDPTQLGVRFGADRSKTARKARQDCGSGRRADENCDPNARPCHWDSAVDPVAGIWLPYGTEQKC